MVSLIWINIIEVEVYEGGFVMFFILNLFLNLSVLLLFNFDLFCWYLSI